MNNNELDPHYPVMPGMELPQNIKVEVHKGELEHLKRLADTAISDFSRLEEENAVLRKMLAAYQRESATGSMWMTLSRWTMCSSIIPTTIISAIFSRLWTASIQS